MDLLVSRLCLKAKYMLEQGNSEQLKSLLDDLREVRPFAEKMGNEKVRLRLQLRTANVLKALDDTAPALALFEKVAGRAAVLGLTNEELEAKISMIHHYLQHGDLGHTLYWLQPLYTRVDSFPPRFAMWVYGAMYHAHLQRGHFEKALIMAEKDIVSATLVGQPLQIALSWNQKGWALFKMERFDQAAIAYLNSLDANPDVWNPTVELALKNLILLYKTQKNFNKMKHYQNLLVKYQGY